MAKHGRGATLPQDLFHGLQREPLAYADGLTAAEYIEGEGDNEPRAIPQEPNWKED